MQKNVALLSLPVTQVWQGDIAIAGGGCAALALAGNLTRAGKKVCLLNPGTAVGCELTQEWQAAWTDSPLDDTIRQTCSELGIPCGPNPDIVGATFAFDQLARDKGITTLLKMLPTEVAFYPSGMLQGLIGVGRNGRQLASASIVIDATPGRKLTRLTLGLPPAIPTKATLSAYLAKMPLQAQESFTLDGNAFVLSPLSWDGEAILTAQLQLGGKESHTRIYQSLFGILFGALKKLQAPGQTLAGSILLAVAPQASVHYQPLSVPLDQIASYGIVPLPETDSVQQDIQSALSLQLPNSAIFPYAAPQQDVRALECDYLPLNDSNDLPVVMVSDPIATLETLSHVIIAGNGVAGVCAALAAAECKAQVTILDELDLPGGSSTSGRLVSHDGMPPKHHATSQEDAFGNPFDGAFHPDVHAMNLLQRELKNPNIALFTGHTVCGVIKNDSAVCAVVTADEDGYHVFSATVTVDCTGDADVAAAAGATITSGRDSDHFTQPSSLVSFYLKDDILSYLIYNIGTVNANDSLDVSRAFFEGRDLAKHGFIPDQEQHLCGFAQMLDICDGRQIAVEKSPSYQDFMNARTCPNAVCSAVARYDNQALDIANESTWARHYLTYFGLRPLQLTVQIPYEAFLPDNVDGLLISGRAIGLDYDLAQAIRAQRDKQAFGEICGVAAAEAALTRTSPRKFRQDLDKLKSILAQRGITPLPPEPICDKPVLQLLADLALPNHAPLTEADVLPRNLAIWKLSTLGKADFWQNHFRNVTQWDGSLAQFCAALAACLGGNRLPAVLAILNQVVDARFDGPLYQIRFDEKTPAPFVQAAVALMEIQASGALNQLKALLDEYQPQGPVSPAALLLLIKALTFVEDRQALDATQILRQFRAKWQGTPFFQFQGNMPSSSFRQAFDLQCADTLRKLGIASKQETGLMVAPYTHDANSLVRFYARMLCLN